jgi:hypothetical protein
MSRNQSNRRAPMAEKKPFCKVCCDAGKSEQEYTSHFVKDRNGNVTCDTLLKQECRYCFKAGHTVKFCPALREKEQQTRVERVRVSRPVEEKKQQQQENNKIGGKFAAFADDSDSEDEVEEKQIQQPRILVTNKMTSSAATETMTLTHDEQFPALSTNVTLRPHQQHFAEASASFAAKLQAPVPKKACEPIGICSSCPQTLKSVQTSDAWSDDDDDLVSVKKPQVKRYLNWADCESSDDEE